MSDGTVGRRNVSGAYEKHNTTWDQEDSPWKAAPVPTQCRLKPGACGERPLSSLEGKHI